MLQLLRNKAQSIVIQIIVVIIALVFIFWGVGANMMGGSESALVINGEEVSFHDFQKAYEREYKNIRSRFGGDIPQSLLDNLGIKEQVKNQLIQEALLRQGAREMGIHISREEIHDAINEMPDFDVDGSFNLERYKSLLARNNYSPSKFEEVVSIGLLTQKASSSISAFATGATDFEIDELYKLEKSTISLNFVKINPNSYQQDISLTDEEISNWYATAQNNYKTDPQVKLKYLDFSYKTVGKKVTIDDAAVAEHYEKNKKDYTIDEKRRARHILFKADKNSSAEVHEQQKKKAEEILALANMGNDFAELAKTHSEGPSKSKGGDLDFFQRGQMVKPFDDAVFALEKGQISGIVQTNYGYHIIKLEDITPSSIQPLESAKDTILKKLQNAQAKNLAFDVATKAYESVIAAGSLQNYLDANSEAPLIETDFFSIKNPPSGIAGDSKFTNTAFALKEKELSSLIETSKGYAILFAEAIQEPQIPELEIVKEQVTKDYIKEKTQELAENNANELLQLAEQNSSLEQAALEKGYSVEKAENLSVNSTETSSFPRELISSAFKLSKAASYPDEIGKSGSDLYVYEFIEKKGPEEAITDEDRVRYKNTILQYKQNQVLSAWLDNKQAKAKVFTHKNL